MLPPINERDALAQRLVELDNFRNYHQSRRKKTQIVLHHTCSSSVQSTVYHWQTRVKGQGTVSTPYIIARDGRVFKLYDDCFWSNHIGAKKTALVAAGPKKVSLAGLLDEHSIGIELVCGGPIAAEHVAKYDTCYYPQAFRGYHYFQTYTQAQLDSLRLLLPHLCSVHNIPTDTIGVTQGGLTDDRALLGIPGIFSHADYRADKSDCHPQPLLLQLLFDLQKNPHPI